MAGAPIDWDALEPKIIALLNSGSSLRRISRMLGISTCSMNTYYNKFLADYPRVTKKIENRKVYDWERIEKVVVLLKEQDMSLYEIAIRIGISYSTLYMHYNKEKCRIYNDTRLNKEALNDMQDFQPSTSKYPCPHLHHIPCIDECTACSYPGCCIYDDLDEDSRFRFGVAQK